MTSARLILDLLARGRSHRYGPHPSQRADLHVPPGPGPHPVVVLIHGGSWHKRYGKIFTRALAGDLLRRGHAVWNIEYRRVGAGGGWPETFADVAAAIDRLAALEDPRLDLDRVTLVGHSAGGHLALWAASRANLPAGAPGAPGAFTASAPGEAWEDSRGDAPHDAHTRNASAWVRPRLVVSLAGVADLAGAYHRWGGGVVRDLMGGSPEELDDRYAVADPMRLLPPEMPVLIVHGIHDPTVTIELSRDYAAAVRAAGAAAELVEIDGAVGHRTHLDPRSAAWAAVVERLDGSYS